MIAFLSSYGIIMLFGLIALESAGLPLPGETALIAASVLASQGHFSIAVVIAVAAIAAIFGDNLGYSFGRFGGRRLLHASPWLSRRADRLLPRSQRFFERHGGKAVFLARFLPVLRFTAAWTAGLSLMTWWRFLLWNALGGITWAAAIGVTAYIAGAAVSGAVARYGMIGAAAAIAIIATGAWVLHLVRKRNGEGESTTDTTSPPAAHGVRGRRQRIRA